MVVNLDAETAEACDSMYFVGLALGRAEKNEFGASDVRALGGPFVMGVCSRQFRDSFRAERLRKVGAMMSTLMVDWKSEPDAH